MKPIVTALVLALVTATGTARGQVPANILVYVESQEYGTVMYDSLLDPGAQGKTELWDKVAVGPAAQVQAEAFADLASATLRGSAMTPGHNSSAISRANISDQFTVNDVGSPTQTGRLTYLFDGKFVAGELISEHAGASAHLFIRMSHDTGQRAWERNVILTTSDCGIYAWPGQTCVRDSSLRLLGSMDIDLLPGQYTFSMSIALHAVHGLQVDFLNTTRAYFELPEGVTINSNSGVLFSTATPVPEPQTWALMLGGLVLAGALARRRAMVAPDAA